MYFIDANKLYKVSLDGSAPQEMISFPYHIGMLKVSKNGDLVVNTGYAKYKRIISKAPEDPDYDLVSSEYQDYLINKDTLEKEEIDNIKMNNIVNLYSSNGERIYTEELDNGQAEILADKLDGTNPVRIGLLAEKLLNTPICEVGENCIEKQHPSEFIPSLNGSYLLNKPPGGGGIGVPAIVVSRDGAIAYKIDFYWYVSSAAWITGDQLLTKAQDGKQKLFTFKQDGTFAEFPFQPEIGHFDQKKLSPTAQHLVLEYDDPLGISLLDLKNNQVITVEKVNSDSRENHLIGFIGWNKKGDKFLYSQQSQSIADSEGEQPTEIREIKIYDLNLNKSFTVVKLHPHPTNPDEYLVEGKPVSNIGQFALY